MSLAQRVRGENALRQLGRFPLRFGPAERREFAAIGDTENIACLVQIHPLRRCV